MSDLTLNDLLSNFMFIRPEALWLLILVIPVAVLSWKTLKNQGQWQKSIDPHLLKFLLLQGESSRSWWPLIILLLTLITAILAFAGPSFEKNPYRFIAQVMQELLFSTYPYPWMR